ncbi:hypothetical protein FXO37_02660 [Capsicum annuum]|nr:hypothetical protein FXO37_02660 [Capsicum annuum]
MSLIVSKNYDYDIGDYGCGKDSHGYEEVGDYGDCEYSHDQDMDENGGYYSKGDYEMNDDPSSYTEHRDDKEPCDSFCEGHGLCEEYYTSHSEPRGNVMYNAFIYKCYESYVESAHMEYEESYSSPCNTSYQIRSGANSYTNYGRGCSMGHKECSSPKPKDIASQTTCSSAQTCGKETQGLYRGCSRSQDYHTLPIIIRESGPEEYLG